mgnify:CR=1 FL=1
MDKEKRAAIQSIVDFEIKKYGYIPQKKRKLVFCRAAPKAQQSKNVVLVSENTFFQVAEAGVTTAQVLLYRARMAKATKQVSSIIRSTKL